MDMNAAQFLSAVVVLRVASEIGTRSNRIVTKMQTVFVR